MPENLIESIQDWAPVAAAVLVLIVAVMQIRFAKRASTKEVLDEMSARFEWLKEIDDDRIAGFKQQLGREFRGMDASIAALRESVGSSVGRAIREIGDLRTTLDGTYTRVDELAEQAAGAERRLAGIVAELKGIRKTLLRSERYTNALLGSLVAGLAVANFFIYRIYEMGEYDVGTALLIAEILMAAPGLLAILSRRSRPLNPDAGT